MNRLLPSPQQFSFVQRVFRALAVPLLDWRVAGLENIPPRGPLLVVLNHTSFLDVIMPVLFFPRPMVSFAKEEAFRGSPYALLLRWMKMIPLRRGEVEREPLRRALQILREGGAFAIAPEGTRTRDGKLIRAKAGVALLAVSSRAPVLPMAIWGATRGSFFGNLCRLRRTRIEVVIGRPVHLREMPVVDRHSRQAIADDLMLQIARLLPKEMHGCYADPSSFPDRYFEHHDSDEDPPQSTLTTPNAASDHGIPVDAFRMTRRQA